MANPNVGISISATDRTASAFGKVRSQMRGMQTETRRMGGAVRNNRRIIQQAGMQLSDFAVQVGGGQSAILAFTQNVPQFIQGFGAVGGVLAGLTTVLGTVALVMVRTGTSMNQLTPMAGILADEFKGLARALSSVKEFMIDTANVLVNNLDRIVIYGATVAGFFATKWVVSFVAARGAVSILTSSLLVLRGVLLRLGFTALIIGAGELVYQLSRLTKGAGGFGAAMGLLWDVVKGAFDRIKGKWQATIKYIEAGLISLKLKFVEAFRDIAVKLDGFFDGFVDKWNKTVGKATSKLTIEMGDSSMLDSINAEVDRLTGNMNRLRREAGVLGNDNTMLSSALAALRDAMKNADVEGSSIDVRDWFGGEDGESALDGLKDKVRTVSDSFKKLSDSIKSSMEGAFMSMVDGTKSIPDAFRSMASEIIKELYRVLVVQRLVNSIVGIFGGNRVAGPSLGLLSRGNMMAPMRPASFDGGGSTPNRARAGGLDGKGGRLAMVHPNEKISPNGGGNDVTVVQNITFESGVSRGEIQAMLPKIVETTKAAVFDAQRRSVNGRGY